MNFESLQFFKNVTYKSLKNFIFATWKSQKFYFHALKLAKIERALWKLDFLGNLGPLWSGRGCHKWFGGQSSVKWWSFCQKIPEKTENQIGSRLFKRYVWLCWQVSKIISRWSGSQVCWMHCLFLYNCQGQKMAQKQYFTTSCHNPPLITVSYTHLTLPTIYSV